MDPCGASEWPWIINTDTHTSATLEGVGHTHSPNKQRPVQPKITQTSSSRTSNDAAGARGGFRTCAPTCNRLSRVKKRAGKKPTQRTRRPTPRTSRCEAWKESRRRTASSRSQVDEEALLRRSYVDLGTNTLTAAVECEHRRASS